MSLGASDGLGGLVSPGAGISAALSSGELNRRTERLLVCVKACGNKQVIDLRDGNLRAVIKPLAMHDGRGHIARCDASGTDARASFVA